MNTLSVEANTLVRFNISRFNRYEAALYGLSVHFFLIISKSNYSLLCGFLTYIFCLAFCFFCIFGIDLQSFYHMCGGDFFPFLIIVMPFAVTYFIDKDF